MKTKKFFTDIQNFWAPKISKEIFVESKIFASLKFLNFKMKKVLFIIPKQSDEYPEYPHTGIGYLSEFLTKNKADNQIIDMRLGHNIEEAINRIKEYMPDFIAVTIVTAKRDKGYEIINKLAGLPGKSGFKIVVGGPHVSMMKSSVLRECKADYAIKCEGEEALLELVEGKKPEKIKNLIFRKNEKIIENQERMWETSLDKFPFPKHEKAELEKYKGGGVSIVTSRGCPYNCTYCSAKLGSGRLFRARSPESIISEISYWTGKGERYFHIVDDNFTLDKNRVIKICDLILRSKIKATFACDGIRADRVDFSVLKKMRDAGFKYLSFGVEAGNNRVLAGIKKGETIEQIENAIKISCELGFEVYLFFLIGSPLETEKDVQDSINICFKYPIAGANFYNLVPFPGTELYEYVSKNNLFLTPPEKYLKNAPYYSNEPVFETPEFPREARIRMLKKTKEVRKEIKRKVLKRRLSKLGILGKISYYFLRYEFMKEVVVGKFLVKIPLIRRVVKKKTEQAFI